MKKIKITLTNGSTIEKPVLTAFKGTYGDYVVLDNESVGSMGLPVILISKIQDNKLNTITDANEWNAIKDNLRNIIAGNQIVKITIGEEYTGDDVYYKQLTLPVASFEALKSTYSDSEGGSVTPAPEPVVPTAPAAPSVEPVAPAAPTMESAPAASKMPSNVNPESASLEQVGQQPVSPMPNVSSVGPMTPEVNAAPTMDAPAPVMPEAPVAPSPVEPVAPEMPMPPMNEMATPQATPEPVVEPIPTMEKEEAPIDVAADKEAFLKACENMFDALVAKFNK